jgi:tetratricopeptide (TPR) repeat protein
MEESGMAMRQVATPRFPHPIALAWALAATLFVSPSVVHADEGHAGHALGAVKFPVSCSRPAQQQFEHALALLHHMTYALARKEFATLAEREPDCAMAHWGVAMTLFQPLWPTRPSPADLERGSRAIAAARVAPKQNARERQFIASAAAFYDNAGAPQYWDRVRRWEAAMQEVHAARPGDDEATLFYALAHLAVAPPDERQKAYADRAVELLLPVYRRNPDHPGAMHYLVHATDVPGRERQLGEVVAKYETVAPHNAHALHMPTHIYTRLGDWPAVVRGNLRSAEAALEEPAGENSQYVRDEFAHAIEYLVYAYLQQGADVEAEAQVRRLHDESRVEPTFKAAFHRASTAARYALERRDWKAAAALPARTPDTLAWDRFPWAEGVTWFARGVGAAHMHDIESAQAAVDRLAQLEETASKSGEEIFTRNIRMLRLAASAWLAQARGDAAQARALLTQAAELEATTPKHPVTPGPTLPAYEQLGDLLLEQKLPAEAMAAYERSLQLYPRRFNSLQGIVRAARANGDSARARAAETELREVAKDGARKLALD